MRVRLGSKGDLVKEVQRKLTERGFDPGPVDGVYGNETRKALARFQESAGLEVDGVAGPQTLEALDIEVKPVGPEREREYFRELLLMNPNYFGNLKVSEFEQVKAKKTDTSYEELKCVGYNPHIEQLHAVVHVKRDYGYGGDICSRGTPQYLRFFVDWNNDGDWDDVGMTSFKAYDLPGDKPLEYAVTLDIDPKEKDCTVENLPKVRAILSWNDLPEAENPDFLPVWGNVVEARIQIDARNEWAIADLLEKGVMELPDFILENLDLSQVVTTVDPKPLPISEQAELYKETGVPAHRFVFPKVKKLLAKPAAATSLNQMLTQALSPVDIEAVELVEALKETDGDTRYEELKCVGYDSERRLLTGILTVKLPYGYLGGLCKEGSKQYVAFWEWDEIEFTWTYLDTAVISAHDIESIPNEGIQYAVSLSVDLSHRRRPCTAGPSEARVRAILSWEDPPPPHNPDWVPNWGNREETRIHIKPGPTPTGQNIPYIETVGNMHVCDIDPVTGLATGEGIIAHFDADRSPFGRTLRITGYIENPPGGVMEGTAAPLKYQVRVRPYDPASPPPWQELSNGFNVWVREEVGLNPPVHKKHPQKIAPADGYYTYLEDPGAPRERHYVIPVLAEWHTSAADTGPWQIQIRVKTASGDEFYGGELVCEADGSTRRVPKVWLDNEGPELAIGLTGYQRGTDPTVHPIGTGTPEKCGKFLQGDVLHGTYSVSDEHFGRLTMTVAPSGPAHGATVDPASRSFDFVPTTGESGTWTLDTAGMDPCGYIVRLWACDRTIVESGHIGFRDTEDVGFCLELPEEE